MSARRVELVHGGSGVPRARPRLEVHVLRELLGRSSCSSRKKPCASSSSGVAVRSSTWRPSAAIGATARQAGSPGWPGGRRSRCASSTTSRSMPAATACSVSRGRAISVSSAITAAAMHVEGVEVGAEVARHVGQPRLVEQREHLVILAPQLAQPLHGQRVGRHDQAALDAAGVHEAVQDQAGLDRLAQADLVGQQPAHRDRWRSRARRRGAGAGRAGCGRRGTSPGPSASRSGSRCRTSSRDREVVELVHVARGQALDEGALQLQRPQLVGRHASPIRQPQRAVGQPRGDRGFLARGRDPHGPAGAEIHRHQRVRVGRQAQGRPRTRELRRPRRGRRAPHAADAEFRIEAVREVGRLPSSGDPGVRFVARVCSLLRVSVAPAFRHHI